jgi:hypothetical protein
LTIEKLVFSNPIRKRRGKLSANHVGEYVITNKGKDIFKHIILIGKVKLKNQIKTNFPQCVMSNKIYGSRWIIIIYINAYNCRRLSLCASNATHMYLPPLSLGPPCRHVGVCRYVDWLALGPRLAKHELSY